MTKFCVYVEAKYKTYTNYNHYEDFKKAHKLVYIISLDSRTINY